MHAATVAVDMAKDVFELAFADSHGRILQRQRLGREAYAREVRNGIPLGAGTVRPALLAALAAGKYAYLAAGRGGATK